MLKLAAQVSLDEVFNGLAFAAGAYALLGRAGCWLTLLICYMAITSSGAGEMVGTSSLFTFDFYRRYINPQVRKMTSARPAGVQQCL